jgi:hypothetical protein
VNYKSYLTESRVKEYGRNAFSAYPTNTRAKKPPPSTRMASPPNRLTLPMDVPRQEHAQEWRIELKQESKRIQEQTQGHENRTGTERKRLLIAWKEVLIHRKC